MIEHDRMLAASVCSNGRKPTQTERGHAKELGNLPAEKRKRATAEGRARAKQGPESRNQGEHSYKSFCNWREDLIQFRERSQKIGIFLVL
jgi:hypothetical protein